MKVSIPSRPIPSIRARAQAEDLSLSGLGDGVLRCSHPGVRWQVPKSAHVGTRKMVNYARRG